MTANIEFPSYRETDSIGALRNEVRTFLNEELAGRKPVERAQTWNGASPAFSRKLGERGWLGMTWPTAYGGGGRSSLERYAVVEEVLAAGAPVAAHWFADRQSGPSLLKFGTEEQRLEILPRIARGECYFAVGMSEPDVGSDLAAVRTRAEPVDGGYVINGTKLWTTNAHLAHYIILLARTSPSDASERHAGLSQFLVDMTTPGIEVRPILIPSGEHHFNEVVLTDVFVPASALLGREGDGWKQVMSELAYERSGPERFLSSFILLSELTRVCSAKGDDRAMSAIGRLSAHLVALRRMSLSVAGQLQAGLDPSLQAVMVKDLGALFEQEIPEIARALTGGTAADDDPDYRQVLTYLTLHAPSFSLRGGAREILRGIIARGLGLR